MAKRQLIRAGIRRQDLARANGRRRQLLNLGKPSAGIRRRFLAATNGKMREISSLDNLRLVFVGGLYQKVVHSSESWLLPLPTGVLFADMLETVNNHSRQRQLSLPEKFLPRNFMQNGTENEICKRRISLCDIPFLRNSYFRETKMFIFDRNEEKARTIF
jgi:hypothetical protein